MNNDIVLINLDRPRQLKFTNSAIKKLLELTGEELDTVDADLTPKSIEKVEKFAYCGLLFDAKEHNETLTMENVLELLDQAENWIFIYEKIISAWTRALTPAAMLAGNQQDPAKLPGKSDTTGKKASA